MRTILVMCALLAGCAGTVSPYDRELQAYAVMLDKAVADGRLAPEEAAYLMAQKSNEMRDRRTQSSAIHTGTALQGYAILNQNRASPVPR